MPVQIPITPSNAVSVCPCEADNLTISFIDFKKAARGLLQSLAVAWAFTNRHITNLEYQSAKDGWIDYPVLEEAE